MPLHHPHFDVGGETSACLEAQFIVRSCFKWQSSQGCSKKRWDTEEEHGLASRSKARFASKHKRGLGTHACPFVVWLSPLPQGDNDNAMQVMSAA
eukprot:1057480-Amphidinium_carterae.1